MKKQRTRWAVEMTTAIKEIHKRSAWASEYNDAVKFIKVKGIFIEMRPK